MVRGFYKHRGRPLRNELKSASLSREENDSFARQVIALKQRFPELKLLSISVKKERVNSQFRGHPNGLYNYMTRLLLLEEFRHHADVNFMPDARSVRTELRHALDDCLRTELAINGIGTRLTTTPGESKNQLEIQFCDILAGIIWAEHEFGATSRFSELKMFVKSNHLFWGEDK